MSEVVRLSDLPFEYYRAPSQEVFNDIKDMAITAWETLEEPKSYINGKINIIKDLENIGSNAWRIINMFHPTIRLYLYTISKKETKIMIGMLLKEEGIDITLCYK